MQNYNSFKISIYTLLFNALRLTLLISFLSLLFFQNGCYKKENFQSVETGNQENHFENRININLASTEDLEKLPRIGEELARRIIEHREKHGKFRRVEHLILVRGMSDKKFREIKNLVKVE